MTIKTLAALALVAMLGIGGYVANAYAYNCTTQCFGNTCYTSCF